MPVTARRLVTGLLVLGVCSALAACARSRDASPSGESMEPGCLQSCCDPATRSGTCWPLLTEAADLDWTERLRSVIAERIRPAPGDQVADIGAGMGWFAKILADRVGATGRVYATDIDPRAIRQLGVLRRPQIEPRLVTDPVDTGLDDIPTGSLSLMLMINSVTVMDSGTGPTGTPRGNDLAYLARLARTLKPGGRFLYHQDWLERDNPRREDVIAMFARAGLGEAVEVPLPADMPERVCMCFTGTPRARTRGYVLEFTRTAAPDGP